MPRETETSRTALTPQAAGEEEEEEETVPVVRWRKPVIPQSEEPEGELRVKYVHLLTLGVIFVSLSNPQMTQCQL